MRTRLVFQKIALSIAVFTSALAAPFALAPAFADGAQAPAKAAAATSVTAEIMVLHATQADGGGGSIDPSIGNMPQLQKPPFSAYNSYKLLDRKPLQLEQGKATTYALPNDHVLKITFVEASEGRFVVKAEIGRPEKAFLKLLEVKAALNEPFFVGGQAYKGGSLVLGIKLLKH